MSPPRRADLVLCGVTVACTAAYGAMKLYWALGGSAGLREVPLPQSAIRDALAREPLAVAGHWVSVVLAVVGVGAALATVHPLGRRLPRWLLIAPLSTLAVLMILRAALAAVGDVQRLVQGVSPPAAYTARWDLVFWCPYFLGWGIAWALLIRRYALRTR